MPARMLASLLGTAEHGLDVRITASRERARLL
jgi:hypothetical protein